MAAEDFLCDFCGRSWDTSRPMVEGHQGSLICGECLSAAYRALVLETARGEHPPGECRMCLEERRDGLWSGARGDAARACARCVRQAAAALSKDTESGWEKPR